MNPIVIGVVVLAVAVLVFMAVKIVPEYQRGVILRLGRLTGAKGPGLFLIIPFIDRMIKVDLRIITMDVPSQDVITRDNVTVRVNAVVYFRVVSPDAAVVNVTDHIQATWQISQTTLRNVIGQSDLDELLSERDKLNSKIQSIVDEQTDAWGVKVRTVEIKDVELEERMRRTMAAQAESERERRAKIIHAKGEKEAAKELSEAGEILAKNSATLQLRYMQTLNSIAAERNSTLIFPLPVDLITSFMDNRKESSKGK
jgi:regulator of protease activity HflC (stomatin/prohibitin superfamily)